MKPKKGGNPGRGDTGRQARREHFRLSRLLKSRWDVFIEAVATILMDFIKAVCRIFTYVGKYTGRYGFAFIFFFINRPLFKAHSFLFEFIYFRRQRRLTILYGADKFVELTNLAVKAIELGRELNKIPQLHER